MTDLSDVISTASLLLALVTALMSFWYSDVTQAIGKSNPNLANERKTLLNQIAPIFWSKALPLAVGSIIIAVVFLNRALQIFFEALESFNTGAKYNDLKAAFLVTEFLLLILAIVTCRLAWRLGHKCWKLN